MRKSLTRLFRDESAATIVEYAIVMMLISIATIAALLAIGNNVSTILSNGQLNH